MTKVAPLPRTITEAQYGHTFEELAHLHGWMVAHFRPAMNRRGQWRTAVAADGKGFPDYLCVQPILRRSLAVELKVGYRKPTPEQLAWIDSLEAAGIPAGVFWPGDWPELAGLLDYRATWPPVGLALNA